jgi:hypothetical protein
MPNYTPADSRGKKILEECKHSAAMYLPTDKNEGIDSDSDGADDDASAIAKYDPEAEYELRTHKAQDAHRIMAAILQSYLQLQEEGMIWDYKYRGKVYKNLELVFFVAFFKCDGDEADKLCGHYRSRGEKVACVCRYCHCPMDKADDENANYKLKDAKKIQRMVERNDEKGLKAISQQNIKLAFDDVRFGLHNGQGIHGACPMELLHHILLGLYKYCRDQFFIQIGLKSELAKEINALAKVLGRFFARQSDRDLPKTNFSKGIFEGKIMGKEFSGVMLLLAAILHTTHGKDLLKKRKTKFGKAQLADWALLVETLLEWEAYLKLPRMEIKHLKRLKQKHRYIMYLMKKIMKRTKGVGFKFMKFHGILHLVMDIIHFGVAGGLDTGSNESHHKLTKLCAKLTQRDISEFEKQTATRLVEFLLLDLAMAELEGKTIWEYFVLDQVRGKLEHDPIPDQIPDNDSEEGTTTTEATTGGSNLEVAFDEKEEEIIWKFARDKHAQVGWTNPIVNFLHQLQETVHKKGIVKPIAIRSEHKRNGQIFRGHPNFRKKGRWNDWAVFEWGRKGGKLPGEIWCFVDFSDLPVNCRFKFGDNYVEQGVYAVIESSIYEDQQPNYKKENIAAGERKSDFFRAIRKDLGPNDCPKYFLANVESIVATACVIPDIGSDCCVRYFHVTPRTEWSNHFIRWLNDTHRHENEEMESDDE